MASDKRIKATMECTECKRRNYTTVKSKVNTRERLELSKFCPWDRKHTVHRETRWPQRRLYDRECTHGRTPSVPPWRVPDSAAA